MRIIPYENIPLSLISIDNGIQIIILFVTATLIIDNKYIDLMTQPKISVAESFNDILILFYLLTKGRITL